MSALAIGQQAPDFKAKDQNGKEFSLSELRGKKVILYFYPKDNTPGCTAESCDFRDHYYGLKQDGFEVIGVSADDEKSHKKFIDKYTLPFALIADTEKEVIKNYDAWGKKQFMGRTFDGILRKTYVIDEEGRIAHIIDKVKTKDAVKQVRELYN